MEKNGKRKWLILGGVVVIIIFLCCIFIKSPEKKKYEYILENYNRDDVQTFEYLNELRNIGYKDSQNLYDDLYQWKTTVFAYSESDDSVNDIEYFEAGDTVYFYFYLQGGEPNQEIPLRVVLSDSDGQEKIFEDEKLWKDGDTGEVFTGTRLDFRGSIKCEVMSKQSILGEKIIYTNNDETGQDKEQDEIDVIRNENNSSNFGLSQVEQKEIVNLAEEITRELQKESMGDDYMEVWDIVESFNDWPEKIEIREGELVHYEDGSAVVDVPVFGNDNLMGLERIFIENGQRVDDVFILNSNNTYIHNSMEKCVFYLDDEVYKLGETSIETLQSRGWNVEKEEEEWYYIMKDDIEKGAMGVLIEDEVIKGIYIADSTEVYRFQFDDEKVFFGDIGRFEIVNGYGKPNLINSTYINYQGKSYLGEELVFKFITFDFRNVGIMYRIES